MSSSRTHRFTGLEIRQGVGNITINYDRGALRISATHDIVVYCNERTNALGIFGLAQCKYFTVRGETLREYIEGSTKIVVDATSTATTVRPMQILENCIDRRAFLGPHHDLMVSNVRLDISSITLDGDVSLNALDPDCIDSECSRGRVFNVRLSKSAALRCPLNANCVIVKMSGATTVSTYRIHQDTRYLWCVSNIIFDIVDCERIEGIEVLKALTIKSPTRRFINASIHRSHTCTYKSVPASLVLCDGRQPTPLVHSDDLGAMDVAINNMNDEEVLATLRNGFVVPASARRQRSSPAITVDVVNDNVVNDDSVDQSVLDESRVLYEADSTPPPLIAEDKRITIEGNPSMEARPTSDKKLRCLVCMENKASVVLLCGHNAFCAPCATSYLSYSSTCPACRTPIARAIALYDGE